MKLKSWRQAAYLTLSILGLVGPWYYNLQFFQTGSLAEFIAATSATLPAQSISLDLFIVTVSGSIWIWLESRRQGLRFAWLYIVVGFTVAFSFAFPFFLFMRERKLSQSRAA